VALGALGGLAGVGLGIVLAKLISAIGIQLPPPPGSTRGFAVQIFVVPVVLFEAFRLSIITAALASLYPAWRAARLNVVEALRHAPVSKEGLDGPSWTLSPSRLPQDRLCRQLALDTRRVCLLSRSKLPDHLGQIISGRASAGFQPALLVSLLTPAHADEAADIV
jgi:hypothetical protein